MSCAQCQRDMHGSARNPVCMQCRSSRKCLGCETTVSWRSTGMCRVCANASLRARPGYIERQREGTRRFNTDPKHAEARRIKSVKAARTKAANPELVERMREAGRQHGAANIVHTRSQASRDKAGRSISATKLAKVPEAYRPMYRDLRRINVPADEALAAVLEQRAVDERRRVAGLTPFQRQMEQAARVGIVAKQDFRRADPAFTLGGVASSNL